MARVFFFSEIVFFAPAQSTTVVSGFDKVVVCSTIFSAGAGDASFGDFGANLEGRCFGATASGLEGSSGMLD